MAGDDQLFVTSDYDRAKVREVTAAMLDAARNKGADSKVALAAAMNVVGFIIGRHYPESRDRLTITEACIQALPQYVGAYQNDRTVLP